MSRWKMLKNDGTKMQMERREHMRILGGALTRVENITYTVLRKHEEEKKDDIPNRKD